MRALGVYENLSTETVTNYQPRPNREKPHRMPVYPVWGYCAYVLTCKDIRINKLQLDRPLN